MCVLILSTNLYENFLIPRRTERNKQKMHDDLHEFFILVIFKRNLSFLDRFSINSQISNLVKIRPVGAALIHADRRSDRLIDTMKLIVASRNFLDMSKTYR